MLISIAWVHEHIISNIVIDKSLRCIFMQFRICIVMCNIFTFKCDLSHRSTLSTASAVDDDASHKIDRYYGSPVCLDSAIFFRITIIFGCNSDAVNDWLGRVRCASRFDVLLNVLSINWKRMHGIWNRLCFMSAAHTVKTVIHTSIN